MAFLIVVLVATVSILLIIRANTLALASIEDAKHSSDIEYQLRLLREQQVTP